MSTIIKTTEVSKEQLDAIYTFVKESTKHFDDSHNWIHADKVYKSTMDITKELKIEYHEDILTYSSLLHDVCDHKYKNSISREELIKFINDKLSEDKMTIVMKIIDNVSFSKENAGKREKIDEPYDLYLTILSDADRLEAIGKIGIERCETFTKSRGGKIPEDVIVHCHEKLLRLYNDKFIKTDYARKLAEPLHKEIIDYVERFSKK